MKKIILLLILWGAFHSVHAQQKSSLQGAWGKEENGVTTLVLITEQIISVSVYNEKEKQFISTWGGTYTQSDNKLQLQYEWNSGDSSQVNTYSDLPFKMKGRKLSWGKELIGLERWGDNQSGDLQGAWIISGNYVDGVVRKRANPFLPRRTMKLIVGNYFQWVSYNVVTKKFFDAGGGEQVNNNGQYSERIAYFTKTPASIGKKLTYSYAMDGDDWRHTGQRSTGGILDECWTRRSRIESQFLPKAN